MRNKTLRLYAWILSIGMIYFSFLKLTGLTIPCFYHATTGLRCPGCGVTRMFFSLLNLDFAQAFSWNPYLLFMFFLWNGIGILCLIDRWSFLQKSKNIYLLFWLSLGGFLLFGILRNFV